MAVHLLLRARGFGSSFAAGAGALSALPATPSSGEVPAIFSTEPAMLRNGVLKSGRSIIASNRAAIQNR